jgi:ATP-dependent exoDNAse (exonuclease V) alpha subunit
VGMLPSGESEPVTVASGTCGNHAVSLCLVVAKALHLLEKGELRLRPNTVVVVVEEAAMVGTDDLRRLLSATTTARVKIVLVGDAHQLAPVKARGGMFEQLRSDLPWTQHLSEVWRMTDPAERTASLALRDGDAAALHRAVR